MLLAFLVLFVSRLAPVGTYFLSTPFCRSPASMPLKVAEARDFVLAANVASCF